MARMPKTTHIKVDRRGIGSIVVDGVDISVYVAPEFTVTNARNETPTVTLNLVGMNVEVEAEAEVEIPEDVAKALRALGWHGPDESCDDGYIGRPVRLNADVSGYVDGMRRASDDDGGVTA